MKNHVTLSSFINDVIFRLTALLRFVLYKLIIIKNIELLRTCPNSCNCDSIVALPAYLCGAFDYRRTDCLGLVCGKLNDIFKGDLS